MPPADREHQRLAALDLLGLLDSPPEAEFDALVEVAQRLLRCKIGLVSLIDEDRQWFKARTGLELAETPRAHSFCSHAVAADELLVVSDATADPRFAANPLVLGAPSIRFYAGVPVHASIPDPDADAVPIGTLCVIDDKPRTLDADDEKVLRDLAKVADALIHARAQAVAAIKLAEDRQDLIQRLDREKRLFHQAERMADMGSWRLTLADNRAEWSHQVYAIHGLPVGDNPPLDAALDFYPPDARADISTALATTISTGQPFDIETDFVTARGTKRRVRNMGELELHRGQPIAVMGVIQDVTQQFQLEQRLRRAADIDDLTGLANRACLNKTLAACFDGARAAGAALGVLLIDLDGFKAMNDRHGHLAGDELLKTVAARLRADYLSDCFAGRLGGDEFVVLLTTPADCRNGNRLVRRLLGDLRHSAGSGPGLLQTSGTIGISWLEDSVAGPSDLLHRADLALYEAKRQCRGSAKTYGQDGLLHPRGTAPTSEKAA